jgi:hypothetical protein
MGLVIRIWDNLLVHGTRYLFRVTIAILKLAEEDLLHLDISGINEYFKAFKDDENPAGSGGANYQPHKLLPDHETIIKESLKIKISDELLDELKDNYKS